MTQSDALVELLREFDREWIGDYERDRVREAADRIESLEARLAAAERERDELKRHNIQLMDQARGGAIAEGAPSAGQLFHKWRAAEARLAELERERDEAIRQLSEEARLRGEAEGNLAVSQWPGVVEGWQARAEAAESRIAELEMLFGECQEARDSIGFLGSVPECIRYMDDEIKRMEFALNTPASSPLPPAAGELVERLEKWSKRFALCTYQPTFMGKTIVDDFDEAALALRAAEARLAAAERERAATLGVGDGRGQLFVHGTHEAIKSCQALIFRLEAAEARERRDEQLRLRGRELLLLVDLWTGDGRIALTPTGEMVVAEFRATLASGGNDGR